MRERFGATGFGLLLMVSTFLAGCLGDGDASSADDDAASQGVVRVFGSQNVTVADDIPDAWGDVTVVAVVDGGLNPYHWDWLGAKMPQHLDDDPSNDVPLALAPHEWIPGFPGQGAFASYEGMHLTLDAADPDRDTAELIDQDGDQWDKLAQSGPDGVHFRYLPGTKVVGLVNFQSSFSISSGAHGARAASVSAGNMYGTCPECVLVFVNNQGEAGMDWVMSQPWIDAVSNSYGFSQINRDRLYSGSDIVAQRDASERGQGIFFSAGNGQANTFTAPNPTLFSSQEGPDWITTVGAVSPGERASYTGHGKPADISSVGSAYPSQGGTTVTGEGTFGGTSSATPTITGMYARALWWARDQLPGPSRMQAEGVVAVGEPLACGAEHAECELGDGDLTVKELRTRVYHGAVHTPAGYTVGLVGDQVTTPPVAELEFLNEGHGTFMGRMDGDEAWAEELARVTGPMDGSAEPLVRPEGEHDWFVVDSYCRQEIWDLSWRFGYYVAAETSLPGPSPMWPLRSALEAACPHLFPPA
jgi:hypothetical protein